MLAENGANLGELRDLLRHSDVRVSQRYLHSSDERLRSMTDGHRELAPIEAVTILEEPQPSRLA